MAIDPSIALSLKPVQIESPLNQMAKIYELQNTVQSNKLNQMKMDEYTRGLAEQEQFKNALAQAQDETAIRNAFYAKGDIKGYSDYVKAQQEAANLKLTGQKTTAETGKTNLESAHKRLDIMGQAFGYVRNNPTPQAAGMALQHLRDSGVIDDATANQWWQQVTADPSKIKNMADMAFTSTIQAKDQLPKFVTQNLGGTTREIGINPITGETTVAQGSETKMTATPGELLSAQTTRRGQDLTNARELQRIEIEKGKSSPEYMALEAKMKQQGKQAAIDAVAVPAAIDSATQAIQKIDELVGKPATKDKSGKVIPGTAPHPGFETAVGASMLPGARFVPGTSAADFDARLKEIQGGAFLEAYNTLKGGGSITEVEGQKATQAITRMSTAQSEKEFVQAARDFQDVLRKGIERAKAKVGGATSATTPAGATVSNW